MSFYASYPVTGGGSGAVISVNGQTGVVVLNKADIGLSNVDNTSDANKPVSTATQNALNLKANLSGATFTGAISATNLSGTNTGDQNLAPYALLSGATFSGAISATNFSGSSSGTNTGDQNLAPYALLASPTFTGVPSAPTATAGTNTTQIATTAFVTTAVAGAGSGANTTLSNLASPTAINQDLLSDTGGGRNIGSPSNGFNQIFGTVFGQNGGGPSKISFGTNKGIWDKDGAQVLDWNNTDILLIGKGQSGGSRYVGFQGASNSYVYLVAPTIGFSNYSMVLPPTIGSAGQYLTTDGAGFSSWATLPSAGANTTLSNLGTTAINAALLSTATNTIPIGSSSNYFSNTYSTLFTTNGSINPDAISSTTPRDIGNLFAFQRVRAARFSPDLTTYTFTGDFTSGNANITNVSPAIPAWFNGGNYTAYASGFTTRLSGSSTDGGVAAINSTSGTTITMATTALASGTTVSFTVVPALFMRTENQTTLQSGIMNINSGSTTTAQSGHMILATGTSTTGRTGDNVIVSGNSSSGGTTGNIILNVGSTSGTKGKIRFTNANEGTIGNVWTSTDTTGGGQWQSLYINAKYNTTAGQTLTASTAAQIINFGTSEWDTNSLVTTGATWNFKASTTASLGKYLVTVVTQYASGVFTVGTGESLSVHKNNSFLEVINQLAPMATVTTAPVLNGSFVINLNTLNDFFDVRIDNNEATSRALNSSSGRNTISIQKIG